MFKRKAGEKQWLTEQQTEKPAAYLGLIIS